MSDEEQYLAIGRMVKERKEVREKLALRTHEVGETAKHLKSSVDGLIYLSPSMSPLDKAISGIMSFQSAGGMDAFLAAVEDVKALRLREQELNDILKKAGAE